jgi:predicted nucleotidyltransferase
MVSTLERATRHARAHIRTDALAAMLYGSAARGDGDEYSDIDVVQLVPAGPGSETVGRLSLVSYLPAQLEQMTAERSLFSWHLRTEGVYIADDNGLLRSILESHAGPDVAATIGRITDLTPVLDVGVAEFERHPIGLVRVARFLLRTAVYAVAIGTGAATYSLRLASAHVDPSGDTFALLERLTVNSSTSWADFDHARARLSALTGELRRNPYGSLEALVVRTELSNSGLSALALHVITDSSGELSYATHGMPIL